MRKLTSVLGLVSLTAALWGNPENPIVVSGTASFYAGDTDLHVIASDRSIISWESFSIESKESTTFALPSSESAVLNRVSSSTASILAGHLSSNGEVYLINPNGILVTKEGVIDTAAFLASTLDLDNGAFAFGGDLLFAGASHGSVINEGTITAWNGDVILLGSVVRNDHVILAESGAVALGVGHEIVVTPKLGERIAIKFGPNSGSEMIGIAQEGVIQALQAELKADGNAYALAIQNTGFIHATGSETVAGRVYLVADGGTLSHTGTIQAAGGEVQLLGNTITIDELAVIDTSSPNFGGTVLIGGDYQGMNPDILNAMYVFVGADAKIHADALTSGNGGKVIVWSDENTNFYGAITATGGPNGGNGGFVEISSHNYLAWHGTADRRAPLGEAGILLLDPSDITISTAVNSNIAFNTAPCASRTYCGTATASSNIQISDLLSNLTTGPVIVDSSTGTGTSVNGTITIANILTIPPGTTNPLTLNARVGLTISAGAVVTNQGSSSVTLNSANGATGNITIGANVINSSSGSIAINSGVGATGNITFSAGINATNSGSGNFTITAGSSAVNTGTLTTSTTSTLTNSGSGNMILTATSAAAATAINVQGPISHSSSGLFQVTTTVGNITTTVNTIITIGMGAGAFSMTAAGTVGATSLTLSGAIIDMASSNFQVSSTNGNVSLVAGATLSFTGGAPVSITAPNGTLTYTSGTANFSGGAGSLTLSSSGALSLNGPINGYSYTGPVQFISTTNSITSNASAALTFNSGAGNVTFSAPQGSITTNVNPLITFNMGAGNLTMTAGTTAMFAGSINSSGTINFNSGVGKTITMTANGAMALRTINYGSTGDATFTSTGAFTTVITTSLVWGGANPAGSLFISGGTVVTSGTIVMNANSGNSPTALGITAVTTLNIAGAVTFNSPFNMVLQNTTGPIANSASLTFNSGAGSLIINGSSIVTQTAISLGSVINYGTSSAMQLTASSGGITVGGTLNSTAGAPVTITDMSSVDTITLSGALTFSGGNGPLTVTAAGNISITGTMAHSYNNLAQFITTSGMISTGATSALSFSGTGGLTMNAFSNLTTNGSITYTSSSPFSMISVTGTIQIDGPVNLATAATYSFKTTPMGRDVIIADLVRNSSTGAFTVDSQNDFSVGIEENTVNYQFGTAGGDITISVVRDVNVYAAADHGDNSTFAQIGYHTGDVSSNINFTLIGRDLNVQAGTLSNCYAIIGHGSALSGATGGVRSGNITFGSMANPIGRNVTVASFQGVPDLGTNSTSFAQIGHTRSQTGTPVTGSGDIDMRFVNGTITLTGGNSNNCYAIIGHGGYSSAQLDSYTGAVQVHSVGNLTMQGGNALQTFAGIGHGAVLSGPGTLTLSSSLIEVISDAQIGMASSNSGDAYIGLYLRSSAAGAIGALSATQITVQTGAASDLTLAGSIPSNSNNGVLIGALSYTGAVPFVAVGTASSVLDITVGRNLVLNTGKGGVNGNTYTAITSGIGTTGAFDVTIDVGNVISLTAGNDLSTISSLNDLSITGGGNCSLYSTNVGVASFMANNDITLDVGTLTMEGETIGVESLVQSSNGSITLTSGAVKLIFATISSSSLLMATLSDHLFMGSDSEMISNLGNFVIDITGSAVVTSAANAIITAATTGDLTVSDDIYLLADPAGFASISSIGALNVMAGGNIVIIGAPMMNNALMFSLQNALTVSAGNNISVLDSGHINIDLGAFPLSVTAGGEIFLSNRGIIVHTGTGSVSVTGGEIEMFNIGSITAASSSVLTVTSTTGDLSLYNNSNVTNTGSGGINMTSNKTMYVQGGTAGTSSVLGNAGGVSLSANSLVMTGISVGKAATVTATGGNLSVVTTGPTFLNPVSSLVLSGTGTLTMAVGSDLLVNKGASINNNGTGVTTLAVAGSMTLLDGGIVSNGAGDFTLTVGQNLNMVSASSVSGGKKTVTVTQNIALVGSTLQGQTDNLSVTAGQNLSLFDGSTIVLSSGTGTLSFAATNGSLIIENGANIEHLGTGPVTGNVQGSGFIRAGDLGDAFIASPSTLTLTFGQALDIISTAGGQGRLNAAGNSSVTAGKINMTGLPNMAQSAFIETTTGTLTVNAGSLNLAESSEIIISGGSGLLTVNATSGDLILSNRSSLSNSGSGGVHSTVSKTLTVQGGFEGGASILAGSGGGVISAGAVTMTGFSGANSASIAASGNGLSVTSTAPLNMTSFASLTLSSSGTLLVNAQGDLFLGNNGLIQNTGSGLTTVTVTGVVNIFGGTAGSGQVLGGMGDMTVMATDSVHLLAGSGNSASIIGLGNLTLFTNQDVVIVGVPGGMTTSAVRTASGTLTITAGGHLDLRDNADIELIAGAGVLTMNASKDLILQNGSRVHQDGTGRITSTIGGNALIRSGSAGDSFLADNDRLDLSVSAILSLESVSSTMAYLSSSGNTNVTAGTLYGIGTSITNALGTLTLSAGTINLLQASLVQLGMGSSGLLKVNATTSEMRIADGTIIQNLGTGGLSSTVSKTLFIEGGMNGLATMITGSGGGTIQASVISAAGGGIVASGGNLSVTSTSTLTLNPVAAIQLTGGTGNLQITSMSDLYVGYAAQILNSASGTTTLNVTGVATFEAGSSGGSSLQGGTGTLTMTVGDNLNLLSDAGGASAIVSTGNIAITAGADISLVGVPGMSLAATITSASGSLSVTAANNIFVSDLANITISSGSNTLTVNTTNGDLYVQSGSQVQHLGTGALSSSIKKNVYLKAGYDGAVAISSNGALTLNAQGDMSIEAYSNANAAITSNGMTSVTAARLLMVGNSSFYAGILDNAGQMTVSAGIIDMIDNAKIETATGANTLTVNATAGNFLIGNGSHVQHLGSGTVSSATNNGTLFIEGGALGGSFISANTGGASVSAGSILLSGLNMANQALISAASGALSVTTTKMLNLAPFSKIVLNGGSMNLNVTVGGNLYLADNTLIHNFGSGSTSQVVMGTTFMCH